MCCLIALDLAKGYEAFRGQKIEGFGFVKLQGSFGFVYRCCLCDQNNRFWGCSFFTEIIDIQHLYVLFQHDLQSLWRELTIHNDSRLKRSFTFVLKCNLL